MIRESGLVTDVRIKDMSSVPFKDSNGTTIKECRRKITRTGV